MQRNEIISLLEDLLQPIKESISSLLTKEKMLNYMDSLTSTLLQKLQDQQLTVNSLKEKNQRLESRVAILEHAIQAHERRVVITNSIAVVYVYAWKGCLGGEIN